MVQFLSINFFLGFLQFLLDFSKVPVFLCHPVHLKQWFNKQIYIYIYILNTISICISFVLNCSVL